MTYLRYNGNGTTATFAVSFAGGGPLRRQHVLVYVGGVLRSDGTHYDLSSDMTQVTFRTGHVPPAGTGNVVLIRSSPSTAATRVVDFAPGAIITATNLDEASLNAMYVAQEAGDRNALTYSPITNQVDGGGRTIVNVAIDFGPVP